MEILKAIGLVVLAVSVSKASVMPAAQVVTAAGLTPIHDRISSKIQTAAANGFHYVSVDMDGVTFKQEKALMKELIALGYKVDFVNDQHVYGWNALNGAILVKW